MLLMQQRSLKRLFLLFVMEVHNIPNLKIYELTKHKVKMTEYMPSSFLAVKD